MNRGGGVLVLDDEELSNGVGGGELRSSGGGDDRHRSLGGNPGIIAWIDLNVPVNIPLRGNPCPSVKVGAMALYRATGMTFKYLNTVDTAPVSPARNLSQVVPLKPRGKAETGALHGCWSPHQMRQW